MPHVIIIAGPNGAGKTTAAPALLNEALHLSHFVNANTIAAGLSAFAPEKVRDIIQSGINAALLKHKQAGNAVCGWKNGKVFWLEPDKIPVEKK